MLNYIVILLFFLIDIVQSQNNGDIQLKGTNKIVEIYNNGEWLPLCDNDFTSTIANLLCKDMGFDRADYYQNDRSCSQSTYANINETNDIGNNFGIDLDDAIGSCLESDASFYECYNRLGVQWKDTNCSNNECLFLTCENIPDSELTDEQKYGNPNGNFVIGDVKISEDDILFYYTGQFFDPVCATGFNQDIADIVCKKLGHNEGQYDLVACQIPDNNQGYRDYNYQEISCTYEVEDLSRCNIFSADQCQYLPKDCVSLKCEGSILEDDTILDLTNNVSGGNPVVYIIISVVGFMFLIIFIIRYKQIQMKKKKDQQQKLKLKQQEEDIQNQNNNNKNINMVAPIQYQDLQQNEVIGSQQQQNIINSQQQQQQPYNYNQQLNQQPIYIPQQQPMMMNPNYQQPQYQQQPQMVPYNQMNIQQPNINQPLQQQQQQVQQPPLNPM